VPHALLLEGDVLRRFYKESMRSVLPPEILGKQKHGFGMPFGNWLRRAPAPGGLATIDRLVAVATTIVFLASAEHSGTNNGQYDMYGYVPNVPGALFAPPPADRAPRTEQSLAHAMPRPLVAAEQIGMVHLLSEPTEQPLGHYPPEFFAGNPEIAPLVARFRDALRAIGYAGEAKPHRLGAYFEAHIEQGPVLEETRTTIGVVLGALGQRWFDVVITGQDAHAGPTPMETRRDAMLAAARLTVDVNRIATTFPDYARGTVGQLQVKPNSRNVVPGEVRMTVDLRNAKDKTLSAMKEEMEKSASRIAQECRVKVEVKQVVYFPPSEFAPDLVASVREGARAFGYSHRDIVSGAAHDAVYMARIAPTAMVFVPCEGGISHNEIENARAEDIAAGCNILLHAVLQRAQAA